MSMEFSARQTQGIHMKHQAEESHEIYIKSYFHRKIKQNKVVCCYFYLALLGLIVLDFFLSFIHKKYYVMIHYKRNYSRT